MKNSHLICHNQTNRIARNAVQATTITKSINSSESKTCIFPPNHPVFYLEYQKRAEMLGELKQSI